MSSTNRELTYSEAIKEATVQIMEKHPEAYLIGLGVDDYKGLWGTTEGLLEIFGAERVFDIPISENALTGIAIGTSLVGLRPIFTHQRIDFMLMCFDALFNHAAKWSHMTGFQKKVPLTVRAIIGRGWGQSVQHAQSFYPVFAHFPGVKVVAPYTPYEAKGLLAAAFLDDDPVIVIEARSLYSSKGYVPEEFYSLDIGKGSILKEGNDITIVGLSYVLDDVLKAEKMLVGKGISAEVINLSSIKPFDLDIILRSVEKTKNLVIVDITWEYFNMASEISSRVTTALFRILKRSPLRIALPDAYVGASKYLEKEYYLDADKIYKRIIDWYETD